MAVIAREIRATPLPSALSLAFLCIPVALVAVAIMVALGVEISYAGRALPGVTVAGVAVGSLDNAAVRDRLESELARPSARALATANAAGRHWTATNADLGIAPDVDAAVSAAIAYGKIGSPADRLIAWIDALRGEAGLPFAVRASGSALDDFVAQIALAIDQPAVSGELRAGQTGLAVTRPAVGYELDRKAARAALLRPETLGDRAIELPVRVTYPAVDESGLNDALAFARAVTTPLAVAVEDRTTRESTPTLATLLRVQRLVALSGDLPPLPADAVAPATRYRYAVSLDEGRLAEWAIALGNTLDRPARSARFTVSAEGRLAVAPAADGIRVDQAKLRAVLREELVRPVASATREITAPATIDRPAFTTEEAQKWLPQMTRTSTFTTYYPENASRFANISTGASQFDGAVILPGQTFSFWALLGEVTVERGYAYAGAIINNRSDENVIGGGLCQVSTTMFNAIARLGYDLVERHAHGYLIERYPLGLDAAVFLPGVDFQWRNDTPNPVFLWSWSGPSFVTFDVWSLPTGRTVVFGDPVQSNFVEVPLDQPADPAFPAGYKVAGRDVLRTRTVYEGGKVLYRDVFFSRYVPVWGGRALVAER